MLLFAAGCGGSGSTEDVVVIPAVDDVMEGPEEPVEADVPTGAEPDIMIPTSDTAEIPPAQPDANNALGMDMNINVNTIDEWLDIEDVAYRDLRVLTDTEPGGIVRGFEVVPYTFLAGEAGQEGQRLFDITLDQTGAIASVKANYIESNAIINDLFPQGAPIFLMCGDGEYAAAARALLIELGYDEALLYNLGGYDEYVQGEGENQIEIRAEAEGVEYNAFHRMNYRYIDFSQLHPAN